LRWLALARPGLSDGRYVSFGSICRFAKGERP
jgi:hypothetical protein